MTRATWATAAALSWRVLAILIYLVAVRPLLRLQSAILRRELAAIERDAQVRS